MNLHKIKGKEVDTFNSLNELTKTAPPGVDDRVELRRTSERRQDGAELLTGTYKVSQED